MVWAILIWAGWEYTGRESHDGRNWNQISSLHLQTGTNPRGYLLLYGRHPALFAPSNWARCLRCRCVCAALGVEVSAPVPPWGSGCPCALRSGASRAPHHITVRLLIPGLLAPCRLHLQRHGLGTRSSSGPCRGVERGSAGLGEDDELVESKTVLLV